MNFKTILERRSNKEILSWIELIILIKIFTLSPVHCRDVFFFCKIRFMTRVCTYSLDTSSFLSFFSDSLLSVKPKFLHSLHLVCSRVFIVSSFYKRYLLTVNTYTYTYMNRDAVHTAYIYIYIHIYIYICCYRDFSDALKTKEAITLPPNDFEKNERLYVNEMEKKENKDSRMYL